MRRYRGYGQQCKYKGHKVRMATSLPFLLPSRHVMTGRHAVGSVKSMKKRPLAPHPARGADHPLYRHTTLSVFCKPRSIVTNVLIISAALDSGPRLSLPLWARADLRLRGRARVHLGHLPAFGTAAAGNSCMHAEEGLRGDALRSGGWMADDDPLAVQSCMHASRYT